MFLITLKFVFFLKSWALCSYFFSFWKYLLTICVCKICCLAEWFALTFSNLSALQCVFARILFNPNTGKNFSNSGLNHVQFQLALVIEYQALYKSTRVKFYSRVNTGDIWSFLIAPRLLFKSPLFFKPFEVGLVGVNDVWGFLPFPKRIHN